MNVIDIASRRRHTEPQPMPALPPSIVSDEVLDELLGRALNDYSHASDHFAGSTAARHRRDLAYARLETVGVVLGRPGLPTELYRLLEAGVHDVRSMVRTARGWDGPVAG